MVVQVQENPYEDVPILLSFEKMRRRRDGRMPVASSQSSARGAARRGRRPPRRVARAINGAHRRYNHKVGTYRAPRFPAA